MADLENWLNRRDIDHALKDSAMDIAAGRIYPMEQVFDELFAELDTIDSK